jgi:hypothetical protein
LVNAASITVGFSGVLFVLIGLGSLVAPEAMVAPVGLSAPDALARGEVRAMYGGLEIGLGAFLGWCVLQKALRPGLLCTAFALGGLGVARAGSWALDGQPAGLHPPLFAFELTMAAVAAWLLWRRGEETVARG